MPEEKQEGSGFKVVDRRSFATDGSVRDASTQAPDAPPKVAPNVAPKVERPAESAPAPSTPHATDAESPEVPPEEDFGFEGQAEGNVDPGFETLVSYLGTTVMFQLGMMAGPGGERIPADLANARHTIEMLEVIERKTHGNLTPDESRLLEDVLYELRITYVEAERRGAARAK